MAFSKNAPPTLGRVDVNQVAREALAFSSTTLRKDGFVVEERLAPGFPRAWAIPASWSRCC